MKMKLAGESIVKYAKEIRADLVVLGSRGLGGWKRAGMSLIGLGSVSDYCSHHAPCAVVVVRHQQQQGDGAAAAGGATSTAPLTPAATAQGKQD